VPDRDCGNNKIAILDIADYPVITYSITPQTTLVTDQGFPTGTRIVQGSNFVLKIIVTVHRVGEDPMNGYRLLPWKNCSFFVAARMLPLPGVLLGGLLHPVFSCKFKIKVEFYMKHG